MGFVSCCTYSSLLLLFFLEVKETKFKGNFKLKNQTEWNKKIQTKKMLSIIMLTITYSFQLFLNLLKDFIMLESIAAKTENICAQTYSPLSRVIPSYYLANRCSS